MKKYFLSILFYLCYLVTGFSQTVTNVGTDFWIAFPKNFKPSAALSIFISSNYTTSGIVYSAFPGVNQSFTVVPGVVTHLSLPSGLTLQGGIENKGIRITSNDPVRVYGLNEVEWSTDAYMALPNNALGLDYWVMSYKVTVLSDMGSCASAFSVVATQNNTTLTIFNHQTNSTTNVNLNQGQTYYVNAANLGNDVTGSRIQSNFPIAVYGSVEGVYIPDSICGAADHIVEEMFPYYSWGKNYVTVSFAGRDGSGDIFRVLAAEDGTDISINGTLVSTINAGAYYEVNLTGYNSITTSKAALVAQFAKGWVCTGGGFTGDPLMMLIPPKEQFLTNYTICNVYLAVASAQSFWVNIVAPDYALGSISEDGVLIPTTAFTQISTTNYYGAQRSVHAGSHTYTSTFPFGVFVYGWGSAESYGYPGGCSLSPIVSVNSVSLLPDTAYGQLNITNVCLNAHVTDNLSNPVSGVLVTFNVNGINPMIGNAYTDAAGNAQYCYTQTGVAPGTDYVFAEVSGFTSNTSVVIWSYTPPCADPTNGGTIGYDQSGCGSYLPASLTNLVLPTGHTGTLEYKWQFSTTSSSNGFIDIPGSNTDYFSPGSITQTTWYKRLARVNCISGWSSAAESNTVTLNVEALPAVTFTTCFDTISTSNAKPFKLKGGIPLNGTYSGPGVSANTFNPAAAGIGIKTITYSYTNAAFCSSSKTKTIIVQAPPAFACGNNLTDIRDGKSYPTVQLGSQCWMAANLNFGALISSLSHQSDNCINEKYCYQDLAANCGNQTFYQWDELMRYEDTPGLQGLCPPGWHVPGEVDWNTLFTVYTSKALAGSPLKYSGFSGFNALLSGTNFLNVNWYYTGFAAYLWSSTSAGPYKALSHAMNDYDASVSSYLSSRVNAFSVRCLID